MKWLVLVAGVCAAWGCSAGDDDDDNGGLEGAPLDCAWLANDNCWKPTAMSASSCVPPSSETGVLSADGRSCTYASGASINFAQPVVLPFKIEDEQEWDFTLRASDGSECLRFVDNPSGKTLIVRGQTYVERYSGLSMQVVCPDGEKYAVQNAFSLFECDNFLNNGSTDTYYWTENSVSFALGFGEGSVQVFSCSR